jgi:hypothetical protein
MFNNMGVTKRPKADQQKERAICAFCGAKKYRQFLGFKRVNEKLRLVCLNEDRCARRCASYG